MTADEIRALPAGRDLDILVAQRVMGWHLSAVEEPDGKALFTRFPSRDTLWVGPDDIEPDRYWSPSTRIAAAWEAVAQLRKTGARHRGLFDACVKVGVGEVTWCEVFDLSPMGYVDAPDFPRIEVEAETVPLAICRAALLAVWA